MRFSDLRAACLPSDTERHQFISNAPSPVELIHTTDPNGHTTLFGYDVRGRLDLTTYPDGTTAASAYDAVGRMINSRDQGGKVTSYGYDSAGRLVSVTNPLGHSTSYAYDSVGNLTSIRDANGHVTSFEYDPVNRRIRKVWPDGSLEAFAYDPLGNLVSDRLADGNTNSFAYDDMTRLVEASYFDGQSLSYTYTATGQRSLVVDGRGTTEYTYDDLDRLTGVTVPSGLSVSYTYDAAGNRRSMTTPTGVVAFGYDDANRLSAVTDPLGGVYSYSYDVEGRRTQLAMPNGVIVEYRYDTLDHLIGLSQRTSSSLLGSYDYILDPAGNRLGVTEVNGSSIAWTYDNAYRLIGETRFDPGGSPSSKTTFTYDPVGNRLSMTVDGVPTNYTYNDLDQILAAGATTFAFDPRGNLTQTSTSGHVTAYSWDALDRLSGATLPDGTALGYTYDADGRRVRQAVDGVDTNYLWDEASLYGDVVLETDAGGAPLASYVLGGPELLAQTRAGATSYYLSDAMGSVRALTDGAGAITDTYDYAAFGDLLAHSGTTANAYLYTGQQFDPLTELYSLRARYYDPGFGRFLLRDPVEVELFNPVEANRYVYAANDPVRMADPSGLWSATAEYSSPIAGVLRALAGLKSVVGVVARPVAWVLVSLLVIGIPGAVPDVQQGEEPALPEVWRDAIERAFERAGQAEALREALDALRRTKPLPGPEPEVEVTPFPPIPIDPTTTPDLIYRSGSRIKDLSLHRIQDGETGLSFSELPPSGKFIRFRTSILVANGYVVRPNSNQPVIKLWTSEVFIDPSTGAGATYPPGHLTVYHSDRGYWDEWHAADLANLNTTSVSPQLLAIYMLREP